MVSPATHPKGTCFVISQIGKDGSPERENSDLVFEFLISHVVEPLGYKPIRADKLPEPGMITPQIVQNLVNAPLVIADLTGKNPNVYYELAVRHTTRKPIVLIITNGEMDEVPFDVIGTRIVPYNLKNPRELMEAQNKIKNQVNSLEASGHPSNPISTAIDLNELTLLKQSGAPEARSTAEVLEAIAQVNRRIISVERVISSLAVNSREESVREQIVRDPVIERRQLAEKEGSTRSNIRKLEDYLRDKKLDPQRRNEIEKELAGLNFRLAIIASDIENLFYHSH